MFQAREEGCHNSEQGGTLSGGLDEICVIAAKSTIGWEIVNKTLQNLNYFWKNCCKNKALEEHKIS